MKTLEIANLPEEVYQHIEKLARVRGKAVGEVAADYIAKGLAAEEAAQAQVMAEIRTEREEMAKRGVYITEERVREAKNWGRP
jgi:hypothetical protein